VSKNLIVTNGTLLEKKYTDYATWTIGGNTLYLPQTVQFATMSNPLEVRMRYSSYDNVGNPLVVSKESDSKVSYLWDSYQTLPIAHIVNSAAATCYYNGFEDGNSDDGDAKSGLKSLITSTGFSQALSSVVNGSYVLSYSQKTSGAWTFHSQPVSVTTSSYTINIPGTVQIDELRFQPAGSQMTTYTYQSGIGVTSVTDANYLTTHYEYDNFGRLLTVRDNNYKILKNYAYHYKDSNGNQ
jgi:YD repeat-containing protein